LPRVIELEPWYPLSIGQDGRLGQFPQLSAVDEGLQALVSGKVLCKI
jgi:hypothetical protein